MYEGGFCYLLTGFIFFSDTGCPHGSFPQDGDCISVIGMVDFIFLSTLDGGAQKKNTRWLALLSPSHRLQNVNMSDKLHEVSNIFWFVLKIYVLNKIAFASR